MSTSRKNEKTCPIEPSNTVYIFKAKHNDGLNSKEMGNGEALTTEENLDHERRSMDN
jgi:hypothetical protein